MNRLTIPALLCLAFLSFSAHSQGGVLKTSATPTENHKLMTIPKEVKKAPAVDSKGIKSVDWDVFSKYDVIKKKSTKDIDALVGKKIKMKGFVIPLDYDSKELKEFLLLPYMPTCSHVPPPPENQIMYVKMDKGRTLKLSYYPLEVTGVFNLAKGRADAMFEIAASDTVELKF